MSLFHIILLAIVQGVAELLPISSSAHVIIAEKLMGLDPSAPEMTFLLVMLHTGTMFAVLFFFWPRWKIILQKNFLHFLKMILIATAITGFIGLGLKKFIEDVILEGIVKIPHGEIEHLFKNLPLISISLFVVGLIIIAAGSKKSSGSEAPLVTKKSLLIGLVQGLCLPFRGFSRSGATISTGLFLGISKDLAEDFSFALAVALTPPVIFLELRRLLKAQTALITTTQDLLNLLSHGILGMIFSAIAGLVALRWLSNWLEKGRWKYFGYYCLFASATVLSIHFLGF